MKEDIDLETSNGLDTNSQLKQSKIGQLSQQKLNASKESFWREKPKNTTTQQINAHIAIIAMKSSYFQQIFLEKMAKKKSKDEKLVIDFNGQV